jgi:solute:Na+ symporter, SSS family
VITSYDHGIIAFYLFFVLAIGLVFRRLSKNTSDYFRAGGAMPWWITGTSAWVATFSAWAFVGAASEVYRSGLKVMMLFYAAVPALVGVALYTCTRFRRMRVVTWMEGVRERFGPGSEQFYTGSRCRSNW